MNLFSDALYQLIAAAGAIAVLFLALVASRKFWGGGLDERLKRLVESGKYEAAADLELERGNLRIALEHFLNADKPARAAEIAQRMDRPRQAAELYEEAGELKEAANMYRLAGMDDKAVEMERMAKRLESPGRGVKKDRDSEGRPSIEFAKNAELEFIEVRDKSENGDEVSSKKLADLGKEAAESLLAIGETRRAADICAEAGLYEQAINLFVNLLGDPGSAAPLMAKKGDHKRAAELYEAAGDKERALEAWIDWACSTSDDPLLYVGEVERLGDERIVKFLSSLVDRKPPKTNNLDLHYRIVSAFEKRSWLDLAAGLLERILAIEPSYRDASQKLTRLTSLICDDSGNGKSAPTISKIGAGADTGEGEETADTDRLIDSPAIEDMVSEVAAAAISKAHSLAHGRHTPGLVPPVWARSTSKTKTKRYNQTTAVESVGLENVNVPLKYGHDEMVLRAKMGPSVERLLKSIGTNTPNPKNIEVFYNLGLAYTAVGRWLDALNAFSVVDEINPKFGDAGERVEEIRLWQKALPRVVIGVSVVKETQSHRYKLLGEIGRGRSSVVCLAVDEETEREVALKFLSKDASAAFKREARSVAQLNHPNIPSVYDIGTIEGWSFISMELVTGMTVEELIGMHTRLKVLDALRIIDSILNALEYAHSMGNIHRYIKPSNMMRNDLGVVKLMDFGLPQSIELKGGEPTMADMPNYMPPEHFSDDSLDAGSDLFSVGASLYEMLTGKTPFYGSERKKQPDPVGGINPTVPKILELIVQRSLEFDRKKRYKSAKEMKKQINQILSSVTEYLDGQRSARH